MEYKLWVKSSVEIGALQNFIVSMLCVPTGSLPRNLQILGKSSELWYSSFEKVLRISKEKMEIHGVGRT